MPSPSGSAHQREVVSAGAVVLGPRKRVLLVHRPRYDDWSFPKGKLDRGEHALTAAVREVHEETGLLVRLGPPLSGQRYPVAAGTKWVHYWVGRPVDGHDVSGYRTNDEIDAVRWVDLDRAPSVLTHAHDVQTLAEALRTARKTRAVVVLRHGIARARRTYRGRDDRRRPLLVAGRRQADRLVAMLEALGVRRLVTSSSTRCVETVTPYADHADREIERLDALSEEGATPDGVRRLTDGLVADLGKGPWRRAGVLVCTHRPVLPWVCGALGVADPRLGKGELFVAHLAQGRVVACARYTP